MFILKSQQTIARAIERARANRPKVHVKTFGEYEVTGHAGARYTVRCWRDRELGRAVDCTCPAGVYGTPCYHSAAAIAQHTYFASAISQ